MSENLEQSAGELPAAGDTTPATRSSTVDLSGTLLTIAEAVERYDVSRATLRRRLDAGAVAGAHKVPGPKGETWAIPAASLVALGYVHREPEDVDDDEPAPAVAPSELLAVVDRLTTLLEGERRQLMASESDRADARAAAAAADARAELLAAELERERAQAAELRAELAQARRRWWRRG